VYTDRMRAEGVSNAIMVLRVDITPFAKQAVQEMSDTYRIEHFKESELLVDITKHQLVPEHQVLTPNEKSALLKRYRLKENQLPRIQPNDPIARYYGKVFNKQNKHRISTTLSANIFYNRLDDSDFIALVSLF
jgi:DNA-directed RNA polymerases I, II, and III subunit RPABC1